MCYSKSSMVIERNRIDYFILEETYNDYLLLVSEQFGAD